MTGFGNFPPGSVRPEARDQLLGYMLHMRQDLKQTREWIETWLDAHCPRTSRQSFDARTLRAIARRLRKRGRELDQKNKRNKALIGASPNNFRVGRACECDLQADNLLSEARRIERKVAK